MCASFLLMGAGIIKGLFYAFHSYVGSIDLNSVPHVRTFLYTKPSSQPGLKVLMYEKWYILRAHQRKAWCRAWEQGAWQKDLLYSLDEQNISHKLCEILRSVIWLVFPLVSFWRQPHIGRNLQLPVFLLPNARPSYVMGIFIKGCWVSWFVSFHVLVGLEICVSLDKKMRRNTGSNVHFIFLLNLCMRDKNSFS